MTEIETIARAQMYLEKLANGVNPLNNEEVAENDVVNNVRISRCLFYTSGILKQIVDNKGKFKVEMPDRAEFGITVEQLANYEYSERPISITEVTKRIIKTETDMITNRTAVLFEDEHGCSFICPVEA